MTGRKTAKRIARFLLGVMLFAHAAVALAACESSLRTPALAVAAAQQRSDAPCHEQDRDNANLCLAHCLAGDQTLDKPGVSVPPLAAASVLAWRSVEVLFPAPVTPRRIAVPPAAAPPRILFRTLLI